MIESASQQDRQSHGTQREMANGMQIESSQELIGAIIDQGENANSG